SVRPWQHVLEPLSGYLTLGSLLYTEGKKYSGAWNFGTLSKNMVSVKRLVEEIVKQWGRGTYVIDTGTKNCPKCEAHLLHLDISKAVNELGWHPVFDFKQAVKFTIEEYRVNNLSPDDIFNQRLDHIQKYVELRKSEEA
ncbi:CDP-glucose 4,6-dehydratase, partial [Patescibacteria group bacterium]|nr:CDP-glucose 4,6-dehydratase [Patescibacteria group bacterium]